MELPQFAHHPNVLSPPSLSQLTYSNKPLPSYAHGMYEGQKKCIWGFGWETWAEEPRENLGIDGSRTFRCIFSIVLQAIREGGWVRQNTTVFYPIYYTDDDMFQPLWAIFRSQKCI